jgi:hypothetical protein
LIILFKKKLDITHRTVKLINLRLAYNEGD